MDNTEKVYNVLIVEDDEKQFHKLRECINGYDYSSPADYNHTNPHNEKKLFPFKFYADPIFQGTYRKIMDRIESEKPDLLFVDIDLQDSEGDGISVVEEVRKKRRIPIVVVSGEIEGKIENEFRTAGLVVEQTIYKPFNSCQEVISRARSAMFNANTVEVSHKNSSKEKHYLTYNEIEYFEKEKGSPRMLVFTKDDEYYFYKSMEKLEKEVPPGVFVKVHMSYMVNFYTRPLGIRRSENKLVIGEKRRVISLVKNNTEVRKDVKDRLMKLPVFDKKDKEDEEEQNGS